MVLDVLTSITVAIERKRLEERFAPLMREELVLGRQVSYAGNKKTPFLRLYRYKEAFSLRLVNRLLDEFEAKPGDVVFDPFSGMGTTLFASMLRGIQSVGIDRLPVAAFVAQTLPRFFELAPGSLIETYERLQPTIDHQPEAHVASDVHLVRLAFDEATLKRLTQWKSAIDSLPSPLREVFLLLFFSILEATSYTSNDGQFPRIKRNKVPVHPDIALRDKVADAEMDLFAALLHWPHIRECAPLPIVFNGDARHCVGLVDGLKPTILITSPPYANRYDYTRSYCLELCFHFVRDFRELRDLRLAILRSHIESKAEATDVPVHPAVKEIVDILAERKLNNPRIVPMLTAYFVDMDKVIEQWALLLAPGARVAMVVDNVRFDGEMVPVDLILSDIAELHGFRVDEVRVARYKGNSSQQMGRFGRALMRESIVIWTKQ